MTVPPLQSVSRLLRVLPLDQSDQRPRLGARDSTSSTPAEPGVLSMWDELSQLALGVDATDPKQVENIKFAVVDVILRHGLGEHHAKSADRAQVVDVIARAISSVTGAQTWSNLIAEINTKK